MRISRGLVLAGTFSVPAGQWIVFLVMARTRGAEAAGEYALLIAVSAPLFMLFGFGLRNRLITDARSSTYMPYLFLRTVMSVFGSVIFISLTLATGFSAALVLLVCLQKCADAFSDIAYGVLQRERRFFSFGALMFANGFLTVVFAVALGIGSSDSSAPVFGSVAASILVAASALICTRRSWAMRQAQEEVLSPFVRRVISVLSSSWPIAIGSFVSVLVVNIPVWGVGLFGDRADVALFVGPAYSITVAALLGTSLSSVAVADYAMLARSGGTALMVHRALRSNRVLTLALVLCAVPFVLFGDFFLALVYGPEYRVGHVVLAMFAAAVVVTPGSYILSAAFLAQNRYMDQMYVTIASLLATIGGIAIAVPLGLDGVFVGALGLVAGAVVRASGYWGWLRRRL